MFLLKWLLYGLAMAPIWFLGTYVLNRFPVWGVIPIILPLAATAVAVLEGPIGGAGYGLWVGILSDATYFGAHGFLTFTVCLSAWLVGMVSRYIFRSSFASCFLCAACMLGVLSFGQVAGRIFAQQASLTSLLQVAIPEFLWSLAFLIPIYIWFVWVKKRIYRIIRRTID